MPYGSGFPPPPPPRQCKTCEVAIPKPDTAGRPPAYCPPCREAKYGRKPATQRLECVCWCEAAVKRIPIELVRSGETVSCGADGCAP